jgi:hypothetical protein
MRRQMGLLVFLNSSSVNIMLRLSGTLQETHEASKLEMDCEATLGLILCMLVC